MKIAILAGGIGTRLWPKSRTALPKQLQAVVGTHTLLQQTYRRLAGTFSDADIMVVTGARYGRAVQTQLPSLPKKNIICEPVGRDSANAIGLAAYRLFQENPDEVLVTTAADHWVGQERIYARILRHAGRVAQQYPDYSILMGIAPTYPETGYGYIRMSKKCVQQKPVRVYGVEQFIEKPTLEKATRLCTDANVFWNPSWFAWRVGHLVELFAEHLPKNHALLKKISAGGNADFQRMIKKHFSALPKISIDYGILEKTTKRLILPVAIQWSDIGHWRSVHEMSRKDTDNNAILGGMSLLLDCHDNLFSTTEKKMIAAIGVHNLVVVETPDAILVTTRDRAHEAKAIVELLHKKPSFKQYI